MIKPYRSRVSFENVMILPQTGLIRWNQGLFRMFSLACPTDGSSMSMASMFPFDFWAIISASTPQPVPMSRIRPSSPGKAHAPSIMESVPTRIELNESSTSNFRNRNPIGSVEVNVDQTFGRGDFQQLSSLVDFKDNFIHDGNQNLFSGIFNLEQ